MTSFLSPFLLSLLLRRDRQTDRQAAEAEGSRQRERERGERCRVFAVCWRNRTRDLHMRIIHMELECNVYVCICMYVML